ncbi:MAG: sodium-dependent bicarbonate transport family permease, partial [Candidatus Anstonellales archaeon]
LTGEKGWKAMDPLFGNLFKGMLAFFLLDMGIVAGRRLGEIKKVGLFLIAFGVLDSLYKDGIKVDEAINIGVKAVNAAMNRDSASGDGIDIFVITKDGGRFFKQAKQDKQDNEKSSENEVREIKVQKRKK